MPVIHDPPLGHDHETRTIHRIRVALEQWLQQVFVLARIVFQVGVLNQAELAARFGHRGPDGRALAAIPLVAQKPHYARITPHKFFDDAVGAIGRTVIHHDDLAFDAIRQRSGKCPAKNGRDVLFFVEERNQNG